MFPNDDICNVDAAKGAAHRLFRRYKNSENRDQPVLGKSQVNRLMKAAYDAINMPYDPNEEDVFSFMDIFDSNKDGQIQLKDLEAMAVKYLCGEQALTQLVNPSQKQKEEVNPSKIEQKEKDESGNKKIPKQQQKIQINIKNNIKQQQQLQIQSQNMVEIKTQIKSQNSLGINFYRPKVYAPSVSPAARGPQIPTKNRSFYRDSGVSTNCQSTKNLKTEKNKKLTQQQIFQKGKQLFNSTSNQNFKGITEAQAGKLMSCTYELFGRKSFAPSKEDVKVWMKLCDRNKDGVVDLEDYKYFLQRTYERQQRNMKL